METANIQSIQPAAFRRLKGEKKQLSLIVGPLEVM
jgi:hypothetical protein